ncbi:hypothetical protein PsorP6_007732 [Peronosclerospora sorghi]|uniref:Uncharacterized protein n=1 Tax=Peronosclerospora sorghi TaxID=230839 RepID=A0ACC0WBB3_9STRA|nr:hypothetical protein PsorP6_007732 [Peronosclerospora sorghi]
MEKTENQTECVICLSEYEKDDAIISLPCGHTFYKGCGLRWLLEHNVFPTCRYQLPTQTDRSFHISIRATNYCWNNLWNGDGAGAFYARHNFNLRQRVNEPAPVDDVVDLDFMLEQEADRFMKEEMANSELVSHDDVIEINDSDIATRY